MSETLATLPTAVRSTVSGALGDPLGLFAEPGPVFEADATFDDDARMPGLTQLLRPGRRYTTFVRVAPTSTDPVVRTVCVKFPDAYGPGSDQDFLFASSGDGAPLHHFTFPRAPVKVNSARASAMLNNSPSSFACIPVTDRTPRA